MTNMTLKVGDKVKIKHLLSWGVCEISAVNKDGRKIRYAVSPMGKEGITYILGLKKKDLEVISE